MAMPISKPYTNQNEVATIYMNEFSYERRKYCIRVYLDQFDFILVGI